MAEFSLNAEVRSKVGKSQSKKLRAAGKIPAVIYGSDMTPLHIAVSYNDAEKLVAKTGRNSLIDIKIDGSENKTVILRDTQKDPITDKLIHLDFQAVHMDKPIKVEVPVKYVGEPIGKKAGAVLEIHINTLKVECLPGEMPSEIEVDISSLDAGEALHVSDLNLKFKILDNKSLTLCNMSVVESEETAEAQEGEEGTETAAETTE